MNRAAAVSAPFVAWHPILFTGDMVRAILAGLKTQTRRCIRVRADEFAEPRSAINGKRPGCAWSANPMVWVVNFQRAS